MIVRNSQMLGVVLVSSVLAGCSGGDAASDPETSALSAFADGGRSSTATSSVVAADGGGDDVAAQTALRTTTVAAETENNTSAASSFAGLKNGDAPAGNVSKLSIHTLAPAGSTAKFFAHYLPWWGSSGHMDIGYSAKDETQIARIVADMKSRGYDGVVLAEANTTGYDEDAALLFATAADAAGLSIIASENHLDSVSAPQTRLADDLTIFEAKLFGLKHYYRPDGQPIVMVFDNDSSIDWAKASSASPSHPVFIYRNTSALTNASFSGGFSWFGSFESSDPLGLSYLDDFDTTALAHPKAIAGADFWKGFDDRLAKWTQDRVIDQHCGATWLQTAGKLASFAKDPGALPLVQVATWDDYEEGTEVETGIDNCATVTASYSESGAALDFAPAFSSSDGSESTVDHYEVFVSSDGSNLRQLARLPAGARSFALGGVSLPSGTPRLYVEMVGKSHIQNHLSKAVPVTR